MTTRSTIRSRSTRPGVAGSIFRFASIDVQPWGLAVDKGDDKFMAFMSDVVKDWHKNGTIIALEKKYNVPVSTFSKQMNAEANKK